MERALRSRNLPNHPNPAIGPHAAAQASQTRLIEHSHQRCEALGLSRIERPDYTPLMRSDLAVARDRNQRLFAHAAPVMQMLFQQIAGTESMIVLTDAQGTVLHSVGDDHFLERAGKVALAPGVSWAEHSKGTNAIGTALFEEAPTLVHAHEHFMHANNFLTCSAAPIFDPRGNMLGVLDVSGDHRSYHQHTMGLVRVSASMIENHWLSDDCSNRLRLHFHSRPEYIGSLLEGILVVGPDGRLLGSNRSALDQLGVSAAALRAQTLEALMGASVASVMDQFRTLQQVPMQLNLPNGRAVYVVARFSGTPRALFAAETPTAAPAADRPAEITPVAAPAARPAPAQARRANAADVLNPADPAHPHPGPVPSAAAPPDVAAAASTGHLHALQTGDAQVDALVRTLRRVLDRDIPLLIQGETGSGKERLARAFHHDSHRANGPFVVVHCAALPEADMEVALFGCEPGALGGARRHASVGRIGEAHGGTLLLKQVGDLPAGVQARLLQVMHDKKLTPLGGTRSLAADVALIGTCQRNLRERVDGGQFREDLYYHLNGLSLRMPALRERSDLSAMARRIVHEERPGGAPQICAQVMALLGRHRWPGNLRELANVLRVAVAMAGDEGAITEAHLGSDFLEALQRTPAADEAAASPRLAAPTRTMKDAGLDAIRAALEAADGNISVAARRIGISRNTIYRKLFWHENR